MRILIALTMLSLTACPPKKPVDGPGDPVVAAAGDAVVVAVPRDPITECPGEPAWLAWAPCKTESALYMVGKAAGVTPLARATAMNRARAELVRLGIGEPSDGGKVVLHGTEAFDSFVCKEETHALVRLSDDGFTLAAEQLSAVETRCDGVAFEPEEDADAACPVWTRRGAWRVGDAVVAVGSVSGIKNRALATKTARNRAMAEARNIGAITLAVTDAKVSASGGSAPVAGIPTEVKMAECDGVIYTKLTLEHVDAKP